MAVRGRKRQGGGSGGGGKCVGTVVVGSVCGVCGVWEYGRVCGRVCGRVGWPWSVAIKAGRGKMMRGDKLSMGA